MHDLSWQHGKRKLAAGAPAAHDSSLHFARDFFWIITILLFIICLHLLKTHIIFPSAISPKAKEISKLVIIAVKILFLLVEVLAVNKIAASVLLKRKTRLFTFLFLNLVLLEASGQFIYFLANGRGIYQTLISFNQADQSRIFQEHPYLSVSLKSGSSAGKMITIDEYGRTTGFNLLPANPNPIKVVCLGGSSTFCVGVKDEETWPYILQQELGSAYRVYNLGVPGYTTAEALIQTLFILPEIKPDIVINYQGWNDLQLYHHPDKSPDYQLHGELMKAVLQQKKMADMAGFWDEKKLSLQDKADMHNPLLYSAIGYSCFKFAGALRSIWNKSKSVEAESWDCVRFSSYSTAYDPVADEMYERNVSRLLTLNKEMNAQSIFINQVLNHEMYHSHTSSHVWTPYVRDDLMPKFLDHYNKIADSIVVAKGSVVIPADQSIRWTTDCFIDDGHFSKKGNVLFAGMAAAGIKTLTKGN